MTEFIFNEASDLYKKMTVKESLTESVIDSALSFGLSRFKPFGWYCRPASMSM